VRGAPRHGQGWKEGEIFGDEAENGSGRTMGAKTGNKDERAPRLFLTCCKVSKIRGGGGHDSGQ
jgi:hypothetical protein